MPRLYICSITGIYPENMCDADIKKWDNFFEDDDPLHFLGAIKLYPVEDTPEAVNTFTAIDQVHEILPKLNQISENMSIRIVVLGVRHSSFPQQAIEYLLREWKGPDGNPRTIKNVEFFTSGDTRSHNMEQFCKWLCLSDICTNLVFINTQDYHPFGLVKREFKD